MLTATGAPVFL